MSLASRLANLFIPTQVPQLAPSDGRATFTLDDGTSNAKSSAYGSAGRMSSTETWTVEEEEEEERPPYLHVRHPLGAIILTITLEMLTKVPVDDCRRHWWNYWRSSYAFH